MHIPKTAGTKFKQNVFITLKEFFHRQATIMIHSSESCFRNYFRANHTQPQVFDVHQLMPGDILVAFFRKPLAQVQSQYYHCADSNWARNRRVDTLLAKEALATFGSWLRYFQRALSQPFTEVESNASASETNHSKLVRDFGCYTPNDMQTRLLTCLGGFNMGHSLTKAYADWAATHNATAEALRNLHSLDLIGLQEYYRESLCSILIEFSGGLVPHYCNCEDEEVWSQFKHDLFHETHRVRPHSVTDISAEEQEIVRDLTRSDVVVYAAAEEKFFRQLRRTEAKYKVKLFCGPETASSISRKGSSGHSGRSGLGWATLLVVCGSTIFAAGVLVGVVCARWRLPPDRRRLAGGGGPACAAAAAGRRAEDGCCERSVLGAPSA